MVTLRDIAEKVGVSACAVSHAVNGTGRLSPKTRERIFSAIRELGYRKNYTARALRDGQSRTIGLVVPVLRGNLTELMSELDLCFRKCDYTLITSFFERGNQFQFSFEKTIERMYNLNVDAVITPTYLNVPKSDIPVIIWGNERDDYDCVYPDKYAFGEEVIERLWSLGHRFIGLAGLGIPGKVQPPYQTERRYLGMRAVLEARHAFDPRLTINVHSELSEGPIVIDYFLSLPRVPTVIVCHSYELAVGVIRAANLRGIRIPEQLSVVGFDYLPLIGEMSPSLATYDQHLSKMAQLLVDVTLNRIRNPDLPRQKRPVTVDFVEGESLAAPRRTRNISFGNTPVRGDSASSVRHSNSKSEGEIS